MEALECFQYEIKSFIVTLLSIAALLIALSITGQKLEFEFFYGIFFNNMMGNLRDFWRVDH
jgi:hypothetical protein